jgi:hypothetical protein
VKAEDPSACVMVSCRLCQSAIALYFVCLKELVTEVPINPVIRNSIHNYSPRLPPYTWQYFLNEPACLSCPVSLSQLYFVPTFLR